VLSLDTPIISAPLRWLGLAICCVQLAACSGRSSNPNAAASVGGAGSLGGPSALGGSNGIGGVAALGIGGSGAAAQGGSGAAAQGGSGAAALGGASNAGTGSGACVAPPGELFDPVASFTSTTLAAAVVVTSDGDSGPGSLRAAVEAAAPNSVIGFDGSLAGKTIVLTTVIELKQGVALDGAMAPGLSIDGANTTQIFHFNGDAPTRIALFNLRLTRGSTAGSGGAISLNGAAIDLEIGGCVFEGNRGSEGGAVRVGYGAGTTINVHDSTFKDNDGSVAGNGNGFSGGALSATGGKLRISRCRFEGNRGPVTGGVFSIHSSPVIEDSLFLNNRTTRTTGGSGAFFADGGGPGDYNTNYAEPSNQIPGEITLRRTRFSGNHGAGDDGGAVEAYAYPLDTVTFESVVFRDNVAEGGRAGAAFIHADKEVRILQSAFVNNHSTAAGGAIWADGSALYHIENSLFSGNVTDDDLGGALRFNISDKAEIRIQSSTFVDNTAKNGNGALWMGVSGRAHVANSIFVNNTGSSGAQQINYPVLAEGESILWPMVGGTSTLPGAQSLDPNLAPLTLVNGMETRSPQPGSRAINGAKSPAPAIDQRGALRDANPDIGAIELGARCAQ